MIKYRLGIAGVGFLALAFIVGASLINPDKAAKEDLDLSEDLRVSKVLTILGDTGKDNLPDTREFGVSANRGETLIKEGFSTKPGGGKTKIQSKHFVCTSCHNLEKEDPDLTKSDPEARLKYTAEKGLPFLQGTTLYGVVNRETFYNDDYYLKYGELVDAARNDIRGAIQLCAVECAQGRKLHDWELESILAYLWTIDLKLSDLDFSAEELDAIYLAIDSEDKQDEAIDLIKSKYLLGSPAHFGSAAESKGLAPNLIGHPENGKMVYENSCLHCHQDRRFSYLQLDDEKLTFKHLSKKAEGYGPHSIFQVSRYGVYSRSGRRSYMPQYPLEKMSDQQLADLKAYIDMRAE
jgi:mono/diheme cytochrome c family protein